VKKEKEKKHTHITQKVKIYSGIQTQNHITTVAQIRFIMLGNGVSFPGGHTASANKICYDRYPFWSHKTKRPECENKRSVRSVYKKMFGHPGR